MGQVITTCWGSHVDQAKDAQRGAVVLQVFVRHARAMSPPTDGLALLVTALTHLMVAARRKPHVAMQMVLVLVQLQLYVRLDTCPGQG